MFEALFPFEPCPDGLKIFVKATPKAKCDRFGPTAPGPESRQIIKVSVTAPAEDGKANAAILNLLAQQLDIPKSRIFLSSGHTSRYKTFVAHGETHSLRQRLRLALGI